MKCAPLSLLALAACACGSNTQSNARPTAVIEGWGSGLAPRALPEVSAESLRASRSVRVCERSTCVVSARFDGEDLARAPAKMQSWVIEPGASLRVDEDLGVDVMGVLVAGSAYVRNTQTAVADVSEDQRVGRWTAVRSRGAGLVVSAPADEPPAAFVLVIARDAPEGMLDPPSATPSADGGAPAKPTPDEAPSRPRSEPSGMPPLEVVSLDAVEWLAWGGGAFRGKILFDRGSQRASLTVLVGGARAPVAEHTHNGAYELLTPVMADGMVRVLGADESALGHQSLVRPGDPQVIPAGTRHGWVPGGTVPLVAVQAYAPAGPEQRFRALSR